MFPTRMNTIRIAVVLAVLLAVAGYYLAGPLNQFIAQPGKNNVQLVAIGMDEPISAYVRLVASFALAGAAAPLGALIWSRFAPPAPYLRRTALLLAVVLLCALAMAVHCRLQFAVDAWVAASLGMAPLVSLQNVPVARIPLVGAGAALALGAGLAFLPSRHRAIAA